MPATLATPAIPDVAADRSAGLRFMARQPILDTHGHLYAYELLFRSGQENSFSGDGEMASRAIVDDAVIYGLDDLAGGVTAFVNCTAEVLMGELAGVLPPAKTVLEILETVEPTPELVAACERLKAQGYRIALDDFVWHPRFEPLVDLADFIKIDFQLSDAEARRDLVRRARKRRIVLLAEKVETQEQYREAANEGFTLFQGYYFCRPVILKKRNIPANRTTHIQILRLLHTDPMDLRELWPLIKSEASLAYRMLRQVNSAGFGVRNEVHSLQDAFMFIGEQTFRRIATLAIASEINTGGPPELLRMALVRGRFCELAAARCSLDATEQYLLGMLSLWPAMLQVPMEELTPILPLSAPVCDALNGIQNHERCPITWLELHERGDFEACDAMAKTTGRDPQLFIQLYAEAVRWAEVSLRSV